MEYKRILGSSSIAEILNSLGCALQALVFLALGIPVVALFM
jgi:hypothetical protein